MAAADCTQTKVASPACLTSTLGPTSLHRLHFSLAHQSCGEGNALFEHSGPRMHPFSLWSQLGSSSRMCNVMLRSGICVVARRIVCFFASQPMVFSHDIRNITTAFHLIDDLSLPSAGSRKAGVSFGPRIWLFSMSISCHSRW